MILSVLGILFPVVLLLALGATLRCIGFFDEAFASKLLRLVFYTALPCMLAGSISRAGSLGGVGAATLALCGTAVLVCTLAVLLARSLGIPRSSAPSFCQTAFRGNAAYVGVPVLSLATAGTATGEETMRVAMLTLAAYSILCNVGAVLLLAGGATTASGQQQGLGGARTESGQQQGLGGATTASGQQQGLGGATTASGQLQGLGGATTASGQQQGVRFAALLGKMAANPLIVGSLVGLALLALRRGFGVMLPAPVVKTMSLLGAMATPGALLALGASLTLGRLRAALRPAALAVAFKLVLCPLLGAAAVAALALPPAHRLAVLVYLACPCSTSSYIMDKAMGGDAELSGAAVVLSTVLCAVSIAAVLLLQ